MRASLINLQGTRDFLLHRRTTLGVDILELNNRRKRNRWTRISRVIRVTQRLEKSNISRDKVSSDRRMKTPITPLSSRIPDKDTFNKPRGQLVQIERQILNKGHTLKNSGNQTKQTGVGFKMMKRNFTP